MKKTFLAASAAAVALVAASAANAAPTFNVTIGSSPITIPAGTGSNGNDFAGVLSSSPYNLTSETFAPGSIQASEDAVVIAEYIGSESGWASTFKLGSITLTENSNTVDGLYSPNNGWGFTTVAGLTNLALSFTSSDGIAANPGTVGFAVYLPASAASMTPGSIYSNNVIYLGYDDGNQVDDNHDDMIIRLTILPVPEPATWAMMIAGVAAVGVSMRRRSATTRIAFS